MTTIKHEALQCTIVNSIMSMRSATYQFIALLGMVGNGGCGADEDIQIIWWIVTSHLIQCLTWFWSRITNDLQAIVIPFRYWKSNSFSSVSRYTTTKIGIVLLNLCNNSVTKKKKRNNYSTFKSAELMFVKQIGKLTSVSFHVCLCSEQEPTTFVWMACVGRGFVHR